MPDYGIVLELVELDVLVADSGLVMKTLMAATLYPLPSPRLVLTRETSMPNAAGATVTYTAISGTTLEEWKRNMEEASLMIWNPLPGQKAGANKN